MEQTILEKTTVLTAHAFDVQRVRFLLPNGKEQRYDLVDHADAVTLLPVTETGEVFFVSQYRIGAEAVLLELPAGVMDAGEQAVLTAHRELREEIGMDSAKLICLGGFFMSPGYSNEYMHVFLAADLYPAPLEQDEDEFLELSRIPVLEVYRLATSGRIIDGKTLATLLMALPQLTEKFPQLRAITGE